MAKSLITIGDYQMLKRCQEENKWAGFQSDTSCKLGSEKVFEVKDSDIKFKAICCQVSGTWFARYTYRVDELLK